MTDKVQKDPKFRVGDTIRYLVNGDIRTIIKVREDNYKLDDCSILHFNAQDNWELVEEPVSTKDKLLALSDGRLHLGWIDDAKVVEFEECLMQFHEDMNNIPQGTDSLTRLKDTDGVLHSYSKKLMSMAKEESVSEGLEIAAHRCYEPNDKFMEGFKKGAKWQKQKDSIVSENLEEASKEWLRPQLDRSYAEYGETKQMELTHFDGYAMLDAIELGAQWKKEQMMKDAVNGLVYAQRTNGEVMFRSNYVKKEGFEFGDKVKVIVIKED